MKKSDSNNLSRQIMEELDKGPDAGELVEIEKLLNDPNAKSIDK